MTETVKALVPFGFFRGLIQSYTVASCHDYEEWDATTTYNGNIIVDIPDDMNLWDEQNSKFYSTTASGIAYQEGDIGSSTGEDPRVEPAGSPWDVYSNDVTNFPVGERSFTNNDRFTVFDGTNQQLTTTSPIAYTLNFDTQIDTILLTGLDNVETVRVQYDTYDKTRTLRNSDFPGVQIDRAVFEGLPNSPTSDCTITITAPAAGDCSVSRILWGRSVTLGVSGAESNLGVTSYPTLTDGAITGNTAFKGARWTVVVEMTNLKFVQALAEAHLNAPIAIWGKSDADFNDLRFGMIREFRPPLDALNLAECELTIQDIDNLL